MLTVYQLNKLITALNMKIMQRCAMLQWTRTINLLQIVLQNKMTDIILQ